MNVITVNGQRIDIGDGNCNVTIRNGNIIVGSNTIISGLSGEVHVKWEGDLANLDSDGSVECGNVHGNVDAGGSVQCGDVGGNVDAGGSIQARGRLGGSINAGGSVSIR